MQQVTKKDNQHHQMKKKERKLHTLLRNAISTSSLRW